MATKNGITVTYIRSNEQYDIYKVIGNGFNETQEILRGSGTTEEGILSEYLN